jgi:hypothetical protein
MPLLIINNWLIAFFILCAFAFGFFFGLFCAAWATNRQRKTDIADIRSMYKDLDKKTGV